MPQSDSQRAREIVDSVNAVPQQPHPGGRGPSFTRPDNDHPAGDVSTFTEVWDYDNPTVREQWEYLDSFRGPYGSEETNKEFWQQANASTVNRWPQERLYADPDDYTAQQGIPRFADDPRTFPVYNDHVTTTPSIYRFFRPYDQRWEKSLSGDHFSMASHMRNYPIEGMEPRPEHRNTFRVEPPPRDTTIVDVPQGGEPNTPPSVYTTPQNPNPLFGDPMDKHR